MTLQENIYRYFENDSSLRILFIFDPTGEKLMELEHASQDQGTRIRGQVPEPMNMSHDLSINDE